VTYIIEKEAADDEIDDGRNINLQSLSVNSSTGAKTISSRSANNFVTSSNFVPSTIQSFVPYSSSSLLLPIEITLPLHAFSPFVPFLTSSDYSIPSTLPMTDENVEKIYETFIESAKTVVV
jgi:hypothetical protein